MLEFFKKLSSGFRMLLMITSEMKIILYTILRGVVGAGVLVFQLEGFFNFNSCLISTWYAKPMFCIDNFKLEFEKPYQTYFYCYSEKYSFIRSIRHHHIVNYEYQHILEAEMYII